jgi:adenosine deaminase
VRRTQWSVLMVLALLLIAPPATSAAAARPSAEAGTAHRLATIRNSPAKLRAFLKAMPKGADLHNHLSGAVPTEALIDFDIKEGI